MATYKRIEDLFSTYNNLATWSNGVQFTLPNGTKSPEFYSKEKATAWYNNWIKNNPDTHISVGGTSAAAKQSKGSGTAARKATTATKPVETQEQKDQRYLQKYGKTEAEAKKAQQQLIEAGYLPAGADDGYWGDKSKAALAKFQEDQESGLASLTDEEREHAKSLGYVDAVKYYSSDDFLNFLNQPDNYSIPVCKPTHEMPTYESVTAPRYLHYFQDEYPQWFNNQLRNYGISQGLIGAHGVRRQDPADNALNDAIFIALTGGAGGVKYANEAIKATGKAARPVIQAFSKATPGNLIRNVGYYAPRLQSSLNKIAPWADAAWYSYWGGTGLDQMYQGITAEGGPNWEQISDGTIRTAMGIPYGLFPEYQVGTSITPAFTTTANTVQNTSNAANRAEAVGNALWLGGIGASAQQPSQPVNENTVFTDNRSSVNTDRLWELSTIFPAVKASVRGARTLFSPSSRWYSPYYRSYEPTKKAAELQKQFDAATKTSKGVYSPAEAKNLLKRFEVTNINTTNYDDAFNAFLRTQGVNPADRYQKFKTITGNTIRTFDWLYPASYWGWRIGSDFTTGGYQVNQGSSLTGDTIITTSEEDPYTVDIPVDPVDSSTVKEDSDETSTGNPPLQ